MDIRLYATFPSRALSNLAPHAFVFDHVLCSSMEGLLQAFKFRDQEQQRLLCQKTGLDAKHAGSVGNGWKKTQTLYWLDEEFDRHGRAYQELLARAYAALAENTEFRRGLIASEAHYLTHRVGHNDATKTVLTADEFCGHLMKLRLQLLEKRDRANVMRGEAEADCRNP